MVDKLKAVLEFVWEAAKKSNIKGIVFAYDEAQVRQVLVRSAADGAVC